MGEGDSPPLQTVHLSYTSPLYSAISGFSLQSSCQTPSNLQSLSRSNHFEDKRAIHIQFFRNLAMKRYFNALLISISRFSGVAEPENSLGFGAER